MSVAVLLLGDSRFPAGGHAYSGGVEPAVTAGTVTDLLSLEAFLRGRLRTAGLVAAGLAAAACAGASACPDSGQMVKFPEFRGAGFAPEIPDGGAGGARGGAGGARGGAGGRASRVGDVEPGESAEVVLGDEFWLELDAEADARTPSPAQRAASRRQGRALLRAARVAWPEAPGLSSLAGSVRADGTGATRATTSAADSGTADSGTADSGTADSGAGGAPGAGFRAGPHHAVTLGAAAAAAGCDPAEAARVAAYQSVAGPASAAVRLLALDPMRATQVLARLAAEIDQVAAQAASYADGPLSDLPCASAPALDLLAETHIRAEVRLFES